VRVTLYWKLLIGFGVVISLLAASDAYVLYKLAGVSETTRTAVTEDVRIVDIVKQLRIALADAERFGQKYIVSSDSTYLRLYSEQHRAAAALLDTLEGFREDGSIIGFVNRSRPRHLWIDQTVRDTTGASGLTERAVERQESMIDTLDLVYQDMERIVRAKQIILAEAVRKADVSARRSAEVALMMTVGSVSIAILIALSLARTVTRPLRSLVRATEDIADGTFTKVPVPIGGEMGHLASAFNSMGERLRNANAARAEMMQHISHEIRMPLQTMHSAYYLLTEQTAGPITDQQRRLLNTMRDNVDKIARFSNQFLDLARIEAGMMEYPLSSTDLLAVLDPIIREASVNAARKKITLSYVPASIPHVRANADRCSQVFTNLLNNAVKYTGEGGTITVSLTPTQYGVRICVADNGVGIPTNELPNIFQKFYRASSAGRNGGTGIGLALVRALVKGMEGTIRVESTVGKGSAFFVELKVEE
jgi:signal transduction histidine kinase